MALINRIKQYRLDQLINIIYHKIKLKAFIIKDKMRYVGYKVSYNSDCTVNTDIIAIENLLDNFLFTPCYPHSIVDDSQRVIRLFGKDYQVNSWLEDICTKKKWPSDTYFFTSSTKLVGYGDVKYVLEINKLNYLVGIACKYNNTKDEYYIHIIEKELTLWTKEVAYRKSVANRITMDIAFRSINLIQISMICFKNDYFRGNIYPLIHSLLESYETQIHEFSTPRWFKTGNGANHVIGEMVGIIAIQKWITLVSNKKENTRRLKQEYTWLYETLDKLIAPSGVYLEQSGNYSRLVAEFLIFLDIIEQSLDKKNNSDNFRNRYLYPILQYVIDLSYNNHIPNFGDNDAATVLTALKKDFYDIQPIITYASKLGITQQKELNKYANDGQFLWKSNDANQLYAFTRVKTFSVFKEGAASHNHCDLLSLLLYAKGQALFVDRGCYYYNQEESIRIDNFSTHNHNTVSIAGIEQADIKNKVYYNYPKSSYYTDKGENLVFSGSVSYKGIEHKRSIEYVNGNTIVITDNICSNEDKDANIKFILHEDIKATISTENQNKIELVCKGVSLGWIMFEGVDIKINDDIYYPHYANIIKTSSLTGAFHVNGSKTIKTSLYINY